MDCSLPPALTDQQLLATLDGTADQQVIEHLQQCPACQTRSQTLAGLQARLQARLLRATCPPSLELGEFFLRRLPAPQRLAISQHVRQCPHCTRELGQISEFMKDELTLSQVDNPGGPVQAWVAQLVTGLAGAVRGENRAITLQVETAIITLTLHSAPKGMVTMRGQVAAEEQDLWTGAVVTLQQADTLRQVTAVNDLGAFQFESFQLGEAEITITSLHDTTIRIPTLDLRL